MTIKKSLKFYVVVVATILFTTYETMKAQVTIGDDALPRTGLVLDMKATNPTGFVGGVMLPHVNIDDLGKIPTDFTQTAVQGQDSYPDLEGMLVYNTNVTTGKGVYLWDGENWQLVSSGNGSNGGQGEKDLDNYTEYPGSGTVKLIGITCFDVAMTDDTGGICGALSDRINSFENTFDFKYDLLANEADIKDLKFVYTCTRNDIIESMTTSNTSGTLRFRSNIRTTLTANTDGVEVVVWALFKINDTAYKKSLTVVIKDCQCCGSKGRPGTVVGKSGYIYLTHLYGDDCWMVSNSMEGTASGTNGYANDQAKMNGYYYTWAQAMTKTASQYAACPEGWHLPVDTEFENLKAIIKEDKAGISRWWTTNSNAAFAGYLSIEGNNWNYWNSYGFWWGTSEANRLYNSGSSGMVGPLTSDEYWLSVRCVRNK